MKTGRRLILCITGMVLCAAVLGLHPESLQATGAEDNELAWLGVSVGKVEAKDERKFDLRPGKGVLVTAVADDSPADKVDLEAGDIILSLDGAEIKSPGHFHRMIRRKNPGDTILLEVIHDVKKKRLKVALGAHDGDEDPFEFFSRWPRMFWSVWDDRPYMGVSLQDLNEDLAGYFGVEPGEGVLISDVEEGSPAKEAGLKSGDILTRIEAEKVGSSDDVRDILRDYASGDEIEVTIIRSKKSSKAKVKLRQSRFQDDLDSLKEFWKKLEKQRDVLQRELHRLREWVGVNGGA